LIPGKQVTEGAIFLYIDTIALLLSSYIFWLVVSRLTSPEVLGTYSVIVSFAVIMTGVVSLGMPLGIQGFLGRTFLKEDRSQSLALIKISIAISIVCLTICIVALYVLQIYIIEILRIDYFFLVILIVFMTSNTIYLLLRSIIISSLKTRYLAYISILASAVKFIIAISLSAIGLDVIGIGLAICIFPTLNLILLSFFLLIQLKEIPKVKGTPRLANLIKLIKEIMKASSASWVPSVISLIGSHLGVLTINQFMGPTEAALYFIPFSIANGIITLVSVLSSIARPTLSAMDDGRKMFAWKIIKMTFLIFTPLSLSTLFYSDNILSIFGPEYAKSSGSFEILLLSIFPYAVASTITVLVYSYGKYRNVLYLGLALSVPRVILYFLLIPMYGSTGAAISFLLGAIICLPVSIIIARRVSFKLVSRELVLMTAIPLLLSFAFEAVDINYMIGIPLVIVSSYLIFIRLNILVRKDIQDFSPVLPRIVLKSGIAGIGISLARKINHSF